jgi:hypothetical protein
MGAWTEPSDTFNATTVNGPSSGPAWGAQVTGSVVNHERVMNSHAVQLVTTCIGGEGQFQLLGSLDGTNFYTMSALAVFTGGTTLVVVENVPAQYVCGAVLPYTASTPASVLTVTAFVIAQEEA